jgi:glycosyltransferase involved in cell wall biosynthesis
LKDREIIIKARNEAVNISKGKYIAVLDDDDYWCDNQKLEKQIKFLEENPDYVLVGGGLIRIDKNGKEIHRYLFSETDEEIRKSILFSGPFLQSAVVFKKDIWELVGGYDEQSGSEGWDLMLKLGTKGKMYNFQNYFTYYLENKRDKNFLRNFYKLQIAMRKKYRDNYPGYHKAIFLGRLNYFYGFVPEIIKKLLSPIMSRLRKIVFGSSGHKNETKFSENK